MSLRYLFLFALMLTAPTAVGQPALLVTSNPAGVANDAVLRLTGNTLMQTARLDGVGGFLSIESVVVAPDGTGYATYDTRSGSTLGGGILVVPGVGTQADSARIAGGTARISGSRTMLMAPKGIELATLRATPAGPAQQVLIVSENGGNKVLFFDALTMGNVAPLFALNDLGMSAAGGARKPWDTFYDAAADRLFVATVDGVVVVFEAVSMRRGANTPAAVLTPTLGGSKVTVNLHGIQVIPAMSGTGQTILLTDVGLASSATDGALLAIPYTAGANGNVPVLFINRGASTRLGNPVDLVYNGTSIFVAEKANNELQRYDNFLGTTGDVNVAPTVSRPLPAPESVALTRDGSVVVASNPADVTQDRIFRVNSGGMLATQAFFNGFPLVTDVQSVALAPGNGAYVSFDRPDGSGGVLYVAGLGAQQTGGTIGEGDVVIAGPNTGLRMPKGLLVLDNPRLVVVANLGAQNLVAFSIGADGSPAGGGDLSPAFVVNDLGMTASGARRAPWDLAYDTFNDRLFVAGTDGVVAVFDNFLSRAPLSGPTRTITPTDAAGNKISVNLHGIVYVRAQNVLILSDVGSAASATDGQLFVIANASTASGNTPVRYRNSGAASNLGNPVDIAYFGTTLYVAEKSNNAVQRYDNFLAATGTFSVAPTASVTVTAPESVAITRGTTSNAPVAAAEGAAGLNAYPNPARAEATVSFSLPEAGPVRVRVFDAVGRQVAVLHDGVLGAGAHTRMLDGAGLAGGIYVVRLEAGGLTTTRTLTVLR